MAYHLFNGIRHLVRDVGLGYEHPDVHPHRLDLGGLAAWC